MASINYWFPCMPKVKRLLILQISVAEVVAYVKDKYRISIKRACLVLQGQYVRNADRNLLKPTNLTVVIRY